MAQDDNDAGKKEEQIKLHLQREWILAQTLLNGNDDQDSVWSRDADEVSSHPSSHRPDDDTIDVDVDLSEYADGGYIFQRGAEDG
jgi:hypothetical protein